MDFILKKKTMDIAILEMLLYAWMPLHHAKLS
jgi:hypothetical protein